MSQEFEKIAAAMNKLAADITAARHILTEHALLTFLAADTGLSKATVAKVLRGIEAMPHRCLTSAGRAIRIRND